MGYKSLMTLQITIRADGNQSKTDFPLAVERFLGLKRCGIVSGSILSVSIEKTPVKPGKKLLEEEKKDRLRRRRDCATLKAIVADFPFKYNIRGTKKGAIAESCGSVSLALLGNQIEWRTKWRTNVHTWEKTQINLADPNSIEIVKDGLLAHCEVCRYSKPCRFKEHINITGNKEE